MQVPDTLRDMATVILVRHGRSSANTGGVLAGRSAGVKRDETGHQQAKNAAPRIAPVRLARMVTCPLERCRHTARVSAGEHPDVPVSTERGVIECDYGDWTGRVIRDLAKEALWKTVQTQPSAAVFPGGESLPAMMARATAAVRRLDAEVSAEHGEDATWVAVSHGDIIKALPADALAARKRVVQGESVSVRV